ncbi:hypothetical protein C8F01DRAFT_1088668 [Mycena amicta]|nr:hypothetical protein C8F01DRAFT_1088668 [Mycena amicta]
MAMYSNVVPCLPFLHLGNTEASHGQRDSGTRALPALTQVERFAAESSVELEHNLDVRKKQSEKGTPLCWNERLPEVQKFLYFPHSRGGRIAAKTVGRYTRVPPERRPETLTALSGHRGHTLNHTMRAEQVNLPSEERLGKLICSLAKPKTSTSSKKREFNDTWKLIDKIPKAKDFVALLGDVSEQKRILETDHDFILDEINQARWPTLNRTPPSSSLAKRPATEQLSTAAPKRSKSTSSGSSESSNAPLLILSSDSE